MEKNIYKLIKNIFIRIQYLNRLIFQKQLRIFSNIEYSQTCVQRPLSGPKICDYCWQVVVVQRYLHVNKIEIGTTKWWSLYTSGRYSEVVVNSG
jgi:hypothetical protein